MDHFVHDLLIYNLGRRRAQTFDEPNPGNGGDDDGCGCGCLTAILTGLVILGFVVFRSVS